MSVTISCAPYTLRARHRLSPLAADDSREGALLRVELDDGARGFADLHPWPELGDAPLARQIQDLRRGRPSALARRSLACARLDAAARAQGRWLFAGVQVPPSHHLLGALSAVDEASLEALLAEGQRYVKVKLGRSLDTELRRARALLRGPGAELRWRLDLNACLGADAVEPALAELAQIFGARLDFVEDPCPFDPALWGRLSRDLGLRLALDRETPQAGQAEGIALRVLKPAAQEPERVVAWCRTHRRPLLVTSYLGHPVGQVHAAYQAARLAGEEGLDVERCGLLGHRAYAPNAYSALLGQRHLRLLPAPGTGIGFDELLAAEPWRPL